MNPDQGRLSGAFEHLSIAYSHVIRHFLQHPIQLSGVTWASCLQMWGDGALKVLVDGATRSTFGVRTGQFCCGMALLTPESVGTLKLLTQVTPESWMG